MKKELPFLKDYAKGNWVLSLVFASLFMFITFTTFGQNPNSNVDGGVISTSDDTTICVDGFPDPINVTVTGYSGQNQQWIITDDQNNILALPAEPPFDFDGAGPGICRIWHLSYNGIKPLSKISNLSEIVGRFDLSNYIEVIRRETAAAQLSGGPFEFCVGDGESDNIPEGSIEVSGGTGSNSAWVITDDQGNILGLPPSPYVVNFDGAGEGTCLVWYLTYEDGLEGLNPGNNASDLTGCYSLSNPIEVIRTLPMTSIVLYPNPTTSNITLDFVDYLINNVFVQIRDINNQIQFEYEFDNNGGSTSKLNLNVGSVKSGLYFMTITNLETGIQEIRKVLIN